MNTSVSKTQFDVPSLLLTNRLVFATKQEFADYAEFPALMNNNPLSRLPQEKRFYLVKRLTEDFLVFFFQGVDYYDKDWNLFFTYYKGTSSFFERHFDGKTIIQTESKQIQTAMNILDSVCYKHKRSENKKINNILDIIYDYEHCRQKKMPIDISMLLLMILGVLPRMKEGRPAFNTDPNYDKEWLKVKSFFELVNKEIISTYFDNNSILEFIVEEAQKSKLNRIFFLKCLDFLCKQIEEISYPQDIGKEFRYFYLEGLWQNSFFRDNSSKLEKNIYYEFLLKGQGYDFICYEVFPTLIKYTRYNCAFYYCGNTIMMSLEHPKLGFDSLNENPVQDNHFCEYTVSLEYESEDKPNKMTFRRFSGSKRFEVNLGILKKIYSDEENKLRSDWERKRQEDKYSQYSCCYLITSYGVYAVTKDYIYLIDPLSENSLYQVPKSIDERLDDVNVFSTAGILQQGESGDLWIGFGSCALYIPFKKWDALGIVKTDRIPVDTKAYLKR